MAAVNDLLEPIGGDNPAGANLRYDPIYDKIKLARTEEEEIPQGEWRRERKTADWNEVVKLSTDVLAKRSKDLQIAAWLTEAWVRREGYAGLRAGLELMRELLERFWDHLHPEIDDGDLEFRAVPLEWVAGYLEPAVKSVPLNARGEDFFAYKESRIVGYEEDATETSAKEARTRALSEGKLSAELFDEGFDETPKSFYKQLAADLAACQQELEALDAVGTDKFGDVAPGYHQLRDALEDVQHVAKQLLARKLEKDPDPPEAPDVGPIQGDGGATSDAAGSGGEGGLVAGAAGAGAGGAGAGEAGGVGGGFLSAAAEPGFAPLVAGGGEPRTREAAAAQVAVAARFLRREDARDPSPYLMLRALRWGELRASGPNPDPRLLVAPPTSVRTRLKGLLLDEAWPELLETAEEVMATQYGRGWLDLQRYTLTACDRLGAEYQVVTDAIVGALKDLLRAVPELPRLTLMDDSPTANQETSAWMREEVFAEAEPEDAAAVEALAAAAAGAPSLAPAKRERDPIERARSLLRAGQPQQAIEFLMREVEREKTPRSRFLRRSQLAGLMVDAGLEGVAVPMLNEMLEQIRSHNLEEWEAGETVARPLGLLYRCLEKMEGDAALRKELYLKVCRLDPVLAIGFKDGDGGGSGGGNAGAGGEGGEGGDAGA